jgi:hypothetical protein
MNCEGTAVIGEALVLAVETEFDAEEGVFVDLKLLVFGIECLLLPLRTTI